MDDLEKEHIESLYPVLKRVSKTSKSLIGLEDFGYEGISFGTSDIIIEGFVS